MSETRINRTKWLHIRLTEAEYKKISKGFSQSTKRKISEYARAILLDKPITVKTGKVDPRRPFQIDPLKTDPIKPFTRMW